jgi:hypothetical protein
MRLARIGSLASSLAGFVAPALLCACAGPDVERYEPVAVLRHVPVTCDGVVGTQRDRLVERDDLDDGAFEAADLETASVHVGVVAAANVAAWTEGHGGPLALVVARGAARDALQRHEELGREGALAVASGRVAVISNEHEVSFVERFDLKTAPDAAILDPVVSTFVVGNRVVVNARRDSAGSAWTIEIAARTIDHPRETLVGSVRVLGAPDPVRFQVPLLARVETKTTARLERGEALLLVAPEILDHERVLVAVVAPDWTD